MNLRTLIVVATAGIMQASCATRTYQITGTAEGLNDGDTLFLTTDMMNGTPIDTIVLKDGKFKLSGETDSVVMAMIYSADRNEVNTPFFMEPGYISVTLSDKPGASRVGGTKVNDLWQQHMDSVMVIGKEINKIAEHIYGANVNQQEQMKGMEKIEKLNVRFAQLVARTAEKNIDNEFGYFMLTYYPEEVIDNKLRTKLIAKLPANMQQRPAIKQMKAVLDRAAKTAEGANISDFSQPGLDGNEVSIMSLISQNRVTIIDFWASWCGPCRQEMPFMIELYNQLKDKGLGIVGISLDSNHDAWRNGTKQLGIPWPQMSDLKGWDNAAAKQFNITSIPHTIVVDQKGKILRRGLRGETLKEYVESALK